MKQLLLSAAMLLLAACTKDAPGVGLPPATQEGKNTGGCLINGQRFVATGWGGDLLSNTIPPLDGGFYYDSLYYLMINGVYEGSNTEITLFLRSQSPGSYSLSKNTISFMQGGLNPIVLDHATINFRNSPNETYITNAQHKGEINLTHASRATGISAGTFEFTAASVLDPRKTITITQGRFDRKQ